jgi:protein-disulfide isomerase
MTHLSVPITEADHRAGRDDAPVSLVEYGDYECPHCGRAHPIVQEVRRRMGSALLFVYRHFPLTQIHPHAEHAAETAEAAGAQGKFWEMHDVLFENQDALDDGDLLRYSAALDLDAVRVARELAAGVHTDRVRRDFLSGVRSGVNGTPTFFINGVRHDGPWDFISLMTTLESAAAARVR